MHNLSLLVIVASRIKLSRGRTFVRFTHFCGHLLLCLEAGGHLGNIGGKCKEPYFVAKERKSKETKKKSGPKNDYKHRAYKIPLHNL